MNPFSLFAQARQYAPLSPLQRAILKLVEGLCAVAFVAALPIIASALSSQSPNWPDVAREAGAAAGVAALLALSKWAKAQGDPLLSAAVNALQQDLAPVAPVDPQPAPAQQSPAAVSQPTQPVQLIPSGPGVAVAPVLNVAPTPSPTDGGNAAV